MRTGRFIFCTLLEPQNLELGTSQGFQTCSSSSARSVSLLLTTATPCRPSFTPGQFQKPERLSHFQTMKPPPPAQPLIKPGLESHWVILIQLVPASSSPQTVTFSSGCPPPSHLGSVQTALSSPDSSPFRATSARTEFSV